MRKIITILIIIIILLVVISFSEKEVYKYSYTYKGENEQWAATYHAQGRRTFTENKDKRIEYEGKSNNVLKVTYKKDLADLFSIKNLDISYETSSGVGELSINFKKPPDKKEFIIKSNRLEDKDDKVKVNINIDGKTQTIDLIME